MKSSVFLTLLYSLMLLSGCSNPLSYEVRYNQATETLNNQLWNYSVSEPTGLPVFSATSPNIGTHKTLSVFFEGDGLSWISRTRPSHNPTPIKPVGLELALASATGDRAYFARPCQYTGPRHPACSQQYWHTSRFSKPVIEAVALQVDKIIKAGDYQQIIFVGFSGGATIAALLASARTDVNLLVTVAGNLDHRSWTNYHRLTPLHASVNARNYLQKLTGIKQLHFIGNKDRIMPIEVYRKVLADSKGRKDIHFIHLENMSHTCCWTDAWQHIWDFYVHPVLQDS